MSGVTTDVCTVYAVDFFYVMLHVEVFKKFFWFEIEGAPYRSSAQGLARNLATPLVMYHRNAPLAS